MGGGDELLGARGQGAEECIATPRVEFSEDVIEEEEGGAAVEGVEEAGLSEFEGEGEGALLSFGGEGSGGAVVEDEWKVVAVRADQRESASSFLRVAGGQSGGEVGGGTPLIGNLEGFGGVFTDFAMGGGGPGFEFGDELVAELGQGGAVFDEWGGISGDLACVGPVVLEQAVAGAQGFVVGEQGGSVGGKRLGAEEIEVPPAPFARAADEREVVIAHPDEDGAAGEVARRAKRVFAGGVEAALSLMPEEFQSARRLGDGGIGAGPGFGPGSRSQGIGSRGQIAGETEAVVLAEPAYIHQGCGPW